MKYHRQTYSSKPDQPPPRNKKRMIQEWKLCEMCQEWFDTPVRDPKRFCSTLCSGENNAKTKLSRFGNIGSKK